MAIAKSDHEAKAAEMYANLLQKVWKIGLGIITGGNTRERVAMEMLYPSRQDFGTNFHEWRKLGWITEGHAKKAEALRNALVAFLRSNQPIEKTILWSAIARSSPISFEEFGQVLTELERRTGRSTLASNATNAYHAMVGIEAHERD